jgi:branched-chain amino acid transport system permease protein
MPADAFAIGWSVNFVFITVIGGMGTILGPIIGSFIWVFLSQWLNEFPFLSQLILGIFAITVMLIAPKGITGELEKKFKIDVLSSRRIMKKFPENIKE